MLIPKSKASGSPGSCLLQPIPAPPPPPPPLLNRCLFPSIVRLRARQLCRTRPVVL